MNDSLKTAIERGVDSGRCHSVSAPCPFHIKSDEAKVWYRARLLALRNRDWNSERIIKAVKDQFKL